MVEKDCKAYFPRETEALLYRLSYQAGSSASVYLAGGFVRDLLLGKENRKLNLLLEGNLADYLQHLRKTLPGKYKYYDILETATIYLPDGYMIKIKPLKTDFSAIAAGCEPDVVATLKKELFKCDFTINSLALALSRENFCCLYDFFDGVKDLDEGKIRVLYSLSFVDVPLRLLRAVQIEQRYGFVFAEETGKLFSAAVTAKVLHKASREGIARELRLILNNPAPSRILQRLHELGLWPQLFPRLPFNNLTLSRLQSLEELIAGELLAEKKPFRYNTFIIHLCGLFYGLSRHDLNYLASVLRLKRNEREELLKLLYGDTEESEEQADIISSTGLIKELFSRWSRLKGAETGNVFQ